jgi:hypothetical protein
MKWMKKWKRKNYVHSCWSEDGKKTLQNHYILFLCFISVKTSTMVMAWAITNGPPTGYGIVEDVLIRGAVIGDSRIELILCKFEGIWTHTRLPQKRLFEGCIENALQYKELAIYAIWPLWPWKVGKTKILVLRNVVFWEVPRKKLHDSS